jgi:hypothetical protein
MRVLVLAWRGLIIIAGYGLLGLGFGIYWLGLGASCLFAWGGMVALSAAKGELEARHQADQIHQKAAKFYEKVRHKITAFF